MVHLCAVDFTVRQFIAPLALTLERAGYDVVCTCTKGPHWEELAEMGVSMQEMPIARSGNPLQAAKAVLRLHRWLRSYKPDVLHVHTPVASMIGRLAGWLAGVPTIIYTAHGFYFHDRMPKKKRMLHVALEWIFGRLNDYLFCVSAEDLRTARRTGIASRKHSFYAPNGADIESFRPDRFSRQARNAIREEFQLPPDARVVTIMGRLVREKGYFEFFESARRLVGEFPNLHLLVVGDTVVSEHDDAKARIVEMADVPQLKGHVHFTGLRRDIPELLAITDIFCLPSYREGMPVSIIEAMLMERPTVTTRIRGCRELIRDGEFGFLVEPEDAEQLARALAVLLKRPKLCRRMGRAARREATRLYNQERNLRWQVRLYRRILRRRQR